MHEAPWVKTGALSPGLGSWACSYKLAQRWWLQTVETYALMVVRPEVQNRHASGAALPPEAPGRRHSSPLPASGRCCITRLVAPSLPLHAASSSSACGCLASLCLSLTRTLVTACRAHSGPPGEAPPPDTPNLITPVAHRRPHVLALEVKVWTYLSRSPPQGPLLSLV